MHSRKPTQPSNAASARLARQEPLGHNGGMPKRSSKKKSPEPEKPIETPPPEGATEPGKNPAAVALGRLGGKKGGRARAAKLTKEQRRKIAKKAAEARWRRKA